MQVVSEGEVKLAGWPEFGYVLHERVNRYVFKGTEVDPATDERVEVVLLLVEVVIGGKMYAWQTRASTSVVDDAPVKEIIWRDLEEKAREVARGSVGGTQPELGTGGDTNGKEG